MLSNWRNPPRPVEKSGEQGSRITGNTGKSVDGERDSAGSVVARKRVTPVEPRDPAVCSGSNNTGGKGENDKDTRQFARPEKEPIRQGEGGTSLAFLGAVRPYLQDGNASGS